MSTPVLQTRMRNVYVDGGDTAGYVDELYEAFLGGTRLSSTADERQHKKNLEVIRTTLDHCRMHYVEMLVPVPYKPEVSA